MHKAVGDSGWQKLEFSPSENIVIPPPSTSAARKSGTRLSGRHTRRASRAAVRVVWMVMVAAAATTAMGCGWSGAHHHRADASDGHVLAGAGAATVENAQTSDARREQRPAVINVRSFDELMNLADSRGNLRPEWIDVGLANLLVAYEAGFATQADIHWAREQIYALAEAAKLRLDRRSDNVLPPADQRRRDRRNAERIVETIVEHGFQFDTDDPEGHNPDNLFLHRVLQRKRGYCVSLSLLALSVAYYLDVPMAGVRAPGHLFVRYGDYSNIHGTARNFEMTDHGNPRDNSHYIRKYRIDPAAIINHVYITNLDHRQVMSDVCGNLGSLFYLRGDLKNARKWYEAAIMCDPNNAQAHYNMATAASKAEDFPTAINHYREAIRLNPSDYLSYCNRGRLYFEGGDPEVGFADLAHAVSLQPRNPHAYVQRGVMRAKAHQLAAAEADLRTAVALDPNHVNAHRNLALLLVNQGHPDAAKPFAEKFMELAPHDPAAVRLREYFATLAATNGASLRPDDE